MRDRKHTAVILLLCSEVPHKKRVQHGSAEKHTDCIEYEADHLMKEVSTVYRGGSQRFHNAFGGHGAGGNIKATFPSHTQCFRWGTLCQHSDIIMFLSARYMDYVTPMGCLCSERSHEPFCETSHAGAMDGNIAWDIHCVAEGPILLT